MLVLRFIITHPVRLLERLDGGPFGKLVVEVEVLDRIWRFLQQFLLLLDTRRLYLLSLHLNQVLYITKKQI